MLKCKVGVKGLITTVGQKYTHTRSVTILCLPSFVSCIFRLPFLVFRRTNEGELSVLLAYDR